MKNLLRRELKKKSLYHYNELPIKQNKYLLYIYQNLRIPYPIYCYYLAPFVVKYRSFVNVCYYTNNSHSIINYTYRRNFFRKFYNKGLFVTYQKHSW